MTSTPNNFRGLNQNTENERESLKKIEEDKKIRERKKEALRQS